MIKAINEALWGNGMLFLIIAVGLYLTVKLKFFQFIKFGQILNKTIIAVFRDRSVLSTGDKKSISQFQTLSAALAATMGTGNIIGVGTAIAIGGAGALFWMWISAFLGMAVIYAENYLGTIYRYRGDDGEWIGGPSAYLDKGLGSKRLAVLYAILCVFVSFGMGNMAQSNSISESVRGTFGTAPVITGIITAILSAIVIIGGIKRIGSITEKLIPILSLLYIISSLIIIVINHRTIGSCFGMIFKGAFGISAIGGGISGALIKNSISIGLRRGIFSNEAGLGSSAILHSASEAKSPHLQGMWGIFEVFVDTILCCTLTGLVILTTNMQNSGANGVEMVIKAFESGFGNYAGIFITVSVILFAFATIIGWSYCGESSINYIFGKKGIKYYKIIYISVIIAGAAADLNIVWDISDIFNGLMILPNLTGIILLSTQVKRPDFR